MSDRTISLLFLPLLFLHIHLVLVLKKSEECVKALLIYGDGWLSGDLKLFLRSSRIIERGRGGGVRGQQVGHC